jgi:hypothetical protein
MGEQPDVGARVATGAATWLVVGAFVATAILLAVTASRAVHRAPVLAAPRSAP